MAEEKKEFPWIQLIATVGTIAAALIGITPYLLKLNAPATQPPTVVIVTLPPAVTTEAPVTTTHPVTTAETTPAPTQTTIVTTVATTGPPPTGNETAVPTTGTVTTETVTTVAPTTEPTTAPTTLSPTTLSPTTTAAPTTVVTTVATTLPPGPAIQITVDTPSVPRGGTILANVSTDASVPQVTITLRNSTTFESQPVTQALVQGKVSLSFDTSPYAPGDYTISAAIPDTTSVASASFVIT
jgi:hypothetical protein